MLWFCDSNLSDITFHIGAHILFFVQTGRHRDTSNSLKKGTELKMDKQTLPRSADRSSKGTDHDGREQGEAEREEISFKLSFKLRSKHSLAEACHGHSGQVSPRCPTIGTFRQLSHTHQPFSHALFLSSHLHHLTYSSVVNRTTRRFDAPQHTK